MKPDKKRKSAAFDPIDIYVGKRVKMLRNLLGMSQTALGDSLGLTFQQIQKYERGANRMGASKLFEISEALEAPISFFFAEMPEEVAGYRNVGAGLLEIDAMSTKDAEDVTRAYYAIEDRAIRSALFRFVKALARSGRDR